MNEEQIIKAISEFMGRADLKGVEVPMFVACVEWLNKQSAALQESKQED